MSLKENKALVLRCLGDKPVNLSIVLQKLGEDFKERSVRRWLKELVEEGVVGTTGQKRGTKYFRIKSIHQDVPARCFSSASLKVIERIKKPLYERLPTTYVEEWFDSYRPNSDYYLPLAVRKRLLGAGSRAGAYDPAGTYAHQVFNRLLIDLSYNSSRLEGNTYSLLDTERLLLHGDDPEGKLDAEKIMILNHKEAIRYLVHNAQKLEINRNEIYTLHYLLSDGLVEPSDAGKVRRHGVRIGGSVYIPFEEPKRLDQQLGKIVDKAALIQDPFEQSLFLLAHISYLQAFADVNKRTARLAANIPLIKSNLVPLAFNDVQVEDYMSAMIAIYEMQDIRPLVDLYVYSYLRTSVLYDATIKAMGFDEIRVRYREQRRAVIREIILKGLVGDVISIYVEKEAEGRVPPTKQRAFVEDVLEDIKEMDESRLAGLGVTIEQLKAWQAMLNH